MTTLPGDQTHEACLQDPDGNRGLAKKENGRREGIIYLAQDANDFGYREGM